MMNDHPDNIIRNNSGETLVEVLVAFIVLMIVLATFTASMNSASSAANMSIDKRRISDDEYTDLHADMDSETTPGEKSTNESSPSVVTIPAEGCSGSEAIELNAYKYVSGETVYWVYR